MSTPTRTFARQERLKSGKLIARLFKGAQSYVAYPFRVLWLPAPHAEAAAMLAISVPKRSFKTAVARNRIKRQAREAYRLHKQAFYAQLGPDAPPLALMLVYIAKEALPYADIEAGILKMIRKMPPPDERAALAQPPAA
jgi:ribonuclease P protein component